MISSKRIVLQYFPFIWATLIPVLILTSCGSTEKSDGRDRLIFSEQSTTTAADSPHFDPRYNSPEPFTHADTTEPRELVSYYPPQPYLIGGMSALQSSIQYPAEAKRKGIDGRVLVQFVVEKSGEIDSVRTLRGVHPLLNEEALRVVQQTKWKPAVEDGKPLRVQMALPVTFRLDSASTE
jgi:TonB family protein